MKEPKEIKQELEKKEELHSKCINCINTCKQPKSVIIYKCNYNPSLVK